MYRGCNSDATFVNSLRADDGTFVQCSEDGCNDQQLYQKPTLSCAKCNDSTECAFGQNESTITLCNQNVLFGRDENCFIHSFNGMC